MLSFLSGEEYPYMPFLRDAVFPEKIIYVKIHKNYVYLLQITAIYVIILLYVTVWLHFALFLSVKWK